MLTASFHCKPALVRFAKAELQELTRLVFSRYPQLEWATFARFGWRDTPDCLVLTCAQLDPPSGPDLNHNVPHVAIDESYTLRIALGAEQHKLAVGIIHSHPQGCLPKPSPIDDDMDSYYGRYFSDFAKDRPYLSLILSLINGELVISGRVYWRGEWLLVQHTSAERTSIETWVGGAKPERKSLNVARWARVASAFGKEALIRLRSSTVAIIGAGGTGSVAVEVLARAGVGHLIIVDPDHLEPSNLERVHGSSPEDAEKKAPKVLVALRHVRSIDRSVQVTAIQGRLPQTEVVDAIVKADVALGCTDQQHSRLALSDLCFRYLLPSLDCAVSLEGSDGRVTSQIGQFVRFLPRDPCALCRAMVTGPRIAQELMPEQERITRQNAAREAEQRGERGDPYWSHTPQINTVGYLTTAIGSMAAGYAIGWLTHRFDTPFERLQLNLTAKFFDVTDQSEKCQDDCPCGRLVGWADQAKVDALISPAAHWSPVKIHRSVEAVV